MPMDTQSLQRIVSTVESRRESRPSGVALAGDPDRSSKACKRGSLEAWERANESGAVATESLWPTAAHRWRSLNSANLSTRMT